MKKLILLAILGLALTGCEVVTTTDSSESDDIITTTTTSEEDPTTTTSTSEDPIEDPIEDVVEEPHEDHVDSDVWSVITDETTTLSDGKYYLTENVNSISNLTVSGTVTLCLNGKVLSGNGQGSVITVEQGSDFTISDCQDGAEGVENTLSLYSDESYTYTYNSGVITGGDFTLSGDVYGGGAIRAEYATIRMNSGAIGFNLSRVAELTSGGAYGGAIYMYYCTFIMNGGEISYNESYASGGAIYAEQSHLTINNARILYNISLHAGSAIFLDSNRVEDYTSSITINNSIISDNYACTYGAIAIFSSSRDITTLTINDSEFNDNYAINGGAAIYTYYTTGTITNTSFSDNSANIAGGALYLESSAFDFYDITLTGNSASSGGAVYGHYGTINFWSGSVTNNTATSTFESQSPTAGGIHVNYRCEFSMYGGYIGENNSPTWDNNYDLYVGPQAIINIYAGEVSQYIYAKGSTAPPTINIYGGYIGGLYFSEGTVYLTIYAGYFGMNIANEDWSSYIVDGSYATYLTRTTTDPNYNSSYPYAVYQSE